ncbi:Ca2+-transporting ATPase [Pricia antarctica]|uniref:Ca2+-transporting ATPase n=1 Tax=Pricia antarctica TaxID=641691 RepID=A0A1G7CXR7_9FLAO|nr:cation-transporting P-type ATPase [Pricia antarctica]SDE44132.1 Ca2+-transporting ATPase [Pricia antarctica]
MGNPADFGIEGLSDEAVLRSRKTHGKNTLDYNKEYSYLDVLKSVFKESMVILLAVASNIYFISGNVGDCIFFLVCILAGGGHFQKLPTYRYCMLRNRTNP